MQVINHHVGDGPAERHVKAAIERLDKLTECPNLVSFDVPLVNLPSAVAGCAPVNAELLIRQAVREFSPGSK